MKDTKLKVVKLRIDKEVIKKFYFKDGREFSSISKDAYWNTVEYLKKQLIEYCNVKKQKPIRYDLVCFDYVHDEEPLYHIVDGGHRTYALRELLADGKIEYLDAILIPATTANGWDNQVQRSDDVIAEIKKAGLSDDIMKQRHKVWDDLSNEEKDRLTKLGYKLKRDGGKYVTIIRPW